MKVTFRTHSISPGDHRSSRGSGPAVPDEVLATTGLGRSARQMSASVETPGDLIRFALGLAVCLWIVIHLFMLPRAAEGYRTWVYLGLVVAPLAWAVAVAIW